MPSGACHTRRCPDQDGLLDYREYDGPWSLWFEEHWLKPRLRNLGYEHARFFGGTTSEYDGSFRERVCELRRAGRAVEYYGVRIGAPQTQ